MRHCWTVAIRPSILVSTRNVAATATFIHVELRPRMAKKHQPAAGGNGDSNEGMIVVGLGLIAFMMWMAYHTRVANLILGIRGMEAWVISLFTYQLEETRAWMKYVPRSTVTMGQLVDVSNQIGSYIRWIATPLMLGLGVWLFRKSPTERFKRIYSDKTLPPVVAKLYPWMQISVSNDFSSMDTNKGNWAVARTERQFARQHKLRNERGEIDKDRAAAVFIKQLGPVWLGYNGLKPHAKAIFAMLAARINKDFGAGDKMLMQLATSAAAGKLDMTGVDEMAKKYMESKPIKRLIAAHAYERTILMSMLLVARGGETGKDYLPPNWFLWLKGMDRPLWYALADVGRKTPHVESAGVFCHWLTERTRKKRLEMPWVRNAVDGLIGELAKYVNDDDMQEGLSEHDELLEPDDLPPAPDLPTPENAELAFKTGRGSSLPKLPWLKSK